MLKTVVIVCILVLQVISKKEEYNENPIKFNRLETSYYDLLKKMKVDNLGNRYYVAGMKTAKLYRTSDDFSDPFRLIFSKNNSFSK